MTGEEIVDAVLADSFASGRRADALGWAQYRQALVWDAESWTFAQGSATVTATAGEQEIADTPEDFATALALYRPDGEPLRPVADWRDFAAGYDTDAPEGKPSAFTTIGETLLIGPEVFASEASLLLVYEKQVELLDDTSGTTSGLPDGYDLMLVDGAKADGYRLSGAEQVAQILEAQFERSLAALRRKYLRATVGAGEQPPVYRPGG